MIRRDTPLMRAILAAAATVAVLLVTQLVLPGGSGSSRGTPAAILFGGLVTGALNGLTVIGLVLVYRTSRIVNFAQAALGAAGAIFAYNLVIVYRFPYAVAFIIAVLISTVIAVVVELVLRRFFEAPRLVLTILTIGVGTILSTAGVGAAAGIPIWGEARDLAETFGASQIFPARTFRFFVGDLEIPFRVGHLLALILLVVAYVAVTAFLRYTRLGTAIRASAENTERAELLGINVRSLSTVVWAIAGALAGITMTLTGTIESFALSGRGAPTILIAALAAGVIARMRSIPIAVWSAILISVLQDAVVWSFRDEGQIVEAGLFFVIAFGLLLQRRTLTRASEATSWEAMAEMRPTPRELIQTGGVQNWLRAGVGVLVVLILAFPFLTTSDVVNRASLAAILAIVLLSLVVLTGWAGQVSLGQFGLVAVGALTGAAITSRADLSFWLAIPVCAVVVAGVAIVIGLPALRIQGLFLGVITLAFANAVSMVMFEERYFPWLQPGDDLRRPTLLLLDFEDERSMYYLALFFLGLMIALVLTLRRSRPGRLMIALRENELDLQAFGVNVVRTKLAAFALSGFICGIAGVLYAHHQRAVEQLAFLPQLSIDAFVYAIIGGLGSIAGALFGAAFGSMVELFPSNDPILGFFVNAGFGLLVVLYLFPGGLSGWLFRMRDSIYRIVAQRRQIVVPSLFADIDPAILEQQLVPLAEAPDVSRAATMGPAEGYRLQSSLYRDTHVVEQGAPDERAVMGEVAERVGGAEE
jgi:branched-chain amino acid transport system permease protein